MVERPRNMRRHLRRAAGPLRSPFSFSGAQVALIRPTEQLDARAATGGGSCALVRAFSSSSAPQGGDEQPPEREKRDSRAAGGRDAGLAPSGWLQDARMTFARTRERRSTFQEYVSSGVFQPSTSRIHRLSSWLLFFQLNRPSETQIDMLEFLEGAKHAMETTMRAMYSREFAQFVEKNAKASWAEAAEQLPIAKQLRDTLEPVSFDAFTEFLRFSRSAGIRSELQNLEIHSAHVVGVSFRRIPTRPTTNSSGAVVMGVPVDEHLKIQVEFDVTEHFDMAMPNFLDGSEPKIEGKQVVVRHNKAVWQFTSTVTTPDDIEWVIEPLDLTTA